MLEVRDLAKHFAVRPSAEGRGGVVHAVDGVSFDLGEGETLGLVGESGCGKSTLGRLILRLLAPTAGTIRFRGRDLLRLTGAELREVRREIQVVFQDPFSSLNPRMRVGEIVGEGLEIHRLATGREQRRIVGDLLERVGLTGDAIDRYPHEFSGGQRQRIGIARALALKPRLIVADEPVSALDVSVQAQILNLLQDLQREFGVAYLFIAHDLQVVRYISQRVAIMYLGRIVEQAPSFEIFTSPQHPYTRLLLSAVPSVHGRAGTERVDVAGEPPSPIDPPAGCRFHPRCPVAVPQCKVDSPTLAGTAERSVACHLA